MKNRNLAIDLSIIIVNYKTKDLLDKCLQSILKNIEQIGLEIIVTDNDSQDNSIQMLKEGYPQVILIENQQNLGFAKACNQGIKRSRGKYLFFLNPDTFITENIFQNIIDCFEGNSQVGIGGCYVFYPNGTLQASFFKFTTLQNTIGKMFSLFRFLPRSNLTEGFFWDYPPNKIPPEVDRVLGGAMIIRRDALEEIGGFDELYFLYSEEEDLCYRAKEKGWRVSPIPNTRVFHHHGQSSLKDLKNATFHSFRGAFIYFEKFNPLHKVILFRIIQFWGALFRAIFWYIVYMLFSGKRDIARGRLAGYIRILLSDFKYSKYLIDN